VFDKSDTGIRIKSEKGKFKDAFNSFN
jgi:hypothetical protein